MGNPHDNVDTNWKEKYKTLVEYYNDNYPSKYYRFDKYEYNIDPLEEMDDIDAYDEARQHMEILKCANSFHYFCHKYVKITHPKKGLLPFITYKYQRRVIDEYEHHRFNIISKFRQGGLTTVTVLWAMWRCLFKLDETIMVVSKTDREAIASGEIVKRAMEELPVWMKPAMSKNNDHQKIFDETGCKLFFYSPDAARGRSITYLIIDEAAFIQNMDTFWNAILPTVATGGSVIVVSTVNGVGNWYHETYSAAERGENEFKIINLDYWEHPEYDNEEWVKLIRAQLGEKGWQQEIMRDFLGAGESFIPPNILNDLAEETRKIEPLRTLFPAWANKLSRVSKSLKDKDPGALFIWREPVQGREYIMGVDAAEGVGEDGDNSCFEIIDAVTCEQVAEFYSNSCPNHVFAEICASVGVMYHHALIIVENEKCGMTVLSKLQYDIGYENLFVAPQGKGDKVGMKTTKSSRPMLLETLQARLLTRSMVVRSKRFVHELKHFIFRRDQKRPEATKGYHDDAIISMCLALYARETQQRQNPVGVAFENQYETETYKTQLYQEIKEEIARGKPGEYWMEDSDPVFDHLDIDQSDRSPSITSRVKRSNDGLLREFGW
jgi:hypothetical protein